MRTRVLFVRLVLSLTVASFGAAASAAVVGDLKAGSAGTIEFSLVSIAFNADPSATPPGSPSNAEVAIGTNLTFTGGPLSVTEAIDVSSPVTSTTTLPVTSFLTFAAHANLVYSLTTVGPGSANSSCGTATSVGASCSLYAGSPLVLTNTGAGTAMSLAVGGKASDTGTGGLASGSNWIGVFTGFVSGQTPLQILLYFCPSGTCTASDFTSGRTLEMAQSGDFAAMAP